MPPRLPTAPELIEIPYRTDSAHYVRHILDQPNCVFFDSGYPSQDSRPTTNTGRFDIFSASPSYILYLKDGRLIRQTGNSVAESHLIETKEQLLSFLNTELSRQLNPCKANVDLPYYGGFAGYLGYGLHHYWNEKRPRSFEESTHEQALPDLMLGFYTWAGVVDHHNKRAWLSFLPECTNELKTLVTLQVTKQSSTDLKPEKFKLNNKLKSKIDVNSYKKSIEKIQSYLNSGDCYQVNFSQEFSGSGQGSSWEAYCGLRKKISAPFGGYFSFKIAPLALTCSILCFSPERFIKLNGREVLTQPIKGTAPRSTDSDQDQLNADTLCQSEKDRAENLMIVDLLRNDLGRCCEYGSIKTEKLFELQSFSSVHHLVSTISGSLASRLTAFDLLQASFPGGSITGAPKSRAIEIIDELEPHRRSIYCGSLCYINANGDMDSNIAIRTLLFTDVASEQLIQCWAGGGIVADSDWQQEYQETLDKVNILLKGLEQL